MKPRYRVAILGLCLAFKAELPVRGMQLPVGEAEQAGPKSVSDPQTPAASPLEFFGYACTKDATPERAFLRQGSRILIVAEGDLIEDKYRLVRIGVDAVVVEEMSNARRQTLRLTPPKPQDDSAEAQPAPSVARPGLVRNSSPAAKARQPSK